MNENNINELNLMELSEDDLEAVAGGKKMVLHGKLWD